MIPRGVPHPYICSKCLTPYYPDNGKDEPGRMAGYALGRFEVVCEFCVLMATEHAELLETVDREALDRRLAELGGAW